MRFAQIIDMETERMDEVRALLEERRAQMSGRAGGPTGRAVLRDRSNPDRYLMIVEFDSPEEAMRNSQDPEVSTMAERIGALCTRPTVFTDCDLLDRVDLRQSV
ncbi:hypothetical protein ACLGI4_22495 [Streptomyces sp. HMX112]|uniref:hypothetical protein n=1 Tax=Streptomyces sp. HMX112 TaxID=3390850 RepID=UPI003A80A3BC